MNQARSRFRSATARSVCVLLAAMAVYALPFAQSASKKALTVDDYTKWRSIGDQELSGDGRWVAYVLQLTNTIAAEAKPVLYVKNLDTNDEVSVQHATSGTFSPDSKWIAYQVDPGAAQRARAARSSSSGSATTPGGTPPGETPAPPPSPPP